MYVLDRDRAALAQLAGMTTSFAWLTRGRLDRSWQANPAGCVYALLTIPLIAWLVLSAAANEPVGFRNIRTPLTAFVVIVVASGLTSWLIRWIVSPGILAGPAENPPFLAGISGP